MAQQNRTKAQKINHKRSKGKKAYYGKLDIKKDTVHIFTDGSCFPNPGPGGYAAVLLFNEHKKEVSGHAKRTTNNEMEMRAILEGLKALKPGNKFPVIVYSDSQYCVNCIVSWSIGWQRRGWTTKQGKPVQHAELIKEITALKKDNIAFRWVKGHVGHEHNERADYLAGEARKNGTR